MWRQFDKGLQTLGRGLVDYRGLPTERLAMAAQIRKDLESAVAAKPVRAEIGIVYDPFCEDLQRCMPRL